MILNWGREGANRIPRMGNCYSNYIVRKGPQSLMHERKNVMNAKALNFKTAYTCQKTPLKLSYLGTNLIPRKKQNIFLLRNSRTKELIKLVFSWQENMA